MYQFYLIYEGSDQCGKTTTRKLVEKQRDGKDIVIDRFIGSNIVYGIVFDRYTKNEIEQLYSDEYAFVRKYKPVLIYLYAPFEEIIKRIEKDEHKKINKKILKKTLEEYDKYFENCKYKHKIKINTKEYKQKEVVKKIIEYLKYDKN